LNAQLEKTSAVAFAAPFREVRSEEAPKAEEMLKPGDDEEEVSGAIEFRD
jgi:hypothetical protein